VYPQVVFVARRSGRAIPVLLLMGGGFFIGGDDSRVDDAVLDLEDKVRAVSAL
jgi:hypothetical protein